MSEIMRWLIVAQDVCLNKYSYLWFYYFISVDAFFGLFHCLKFWVLIVPQIVWTYIISVLVLLFFTTVLLWVSGFFKEALFVLFCIFFHILQKSLHIPQTHPANFSTHAQATLQFTLGMAFILKIFLYLWTYLFWKLWVGLTFCCIWKPNYAIYLMYHIAKLFQQKLFLL